MGGSYWGTVGSGAFGTHQRVILAEFFNCFHSHLPVGRGLKAKEKKEERRVWGKTVSTASGDKEVGQPQIITEVS